MQNYLKYKAIIFSFLLLNVFNSNAQVKFEKLDFHPVLGIRCMTVDTDNQRLVLGGELEIDYTNQRSKSLFFYKDSFTTFNYNPSFPYNFYHLTAMDITYYKNKLYVGGYGGLFCINSNFQILDLNIKDRNGGVGVVYTFYHYKDKLLIGGLFDSINNVNINSIAEFDGTSFHNFHSFDTVFDYSTTLTNPNNKNKYVYSICEYNNNIIVGGNFIGNSSSTSTDRMDLMQWDGNNWRNIGEGIASMNGLEFISKVIVFNNELYVSGYFFNIGNKYIRNIAKWNGIDWLPVSIDPFGMNNNSYITDMLVDNDTLVIVGGFDKFNGDTCYNFARMYNNTWELNKIYNFAFLNNIVKFRDTLYVSTNGGQFRLGINDTCISQCSNLLKVSQSTFKSNTVSLPVSTSHPTIPPSYLTIYPNPSRETLYLEADKLMPKIKQTQVYNIAGQLVTQYNKLPSEIDLSKMASGVYFIQLSFDNQSPPLHKIFQKE